MRQTFRRLRAIEMQLLLMALLFFAAGYVLVAAAVRSSAFIPTVRGVADILWPSTLPFFLFLLVSIGMSWRMPQADQLVLPLVALLSGLGLLVIARLAPGLPADNAGVDAKQSLWVTVGNVVLAMVLFVPWDDLLRR